jgi:hypothetical protein
LAAAFVVPAGRDPDGRLVIPSEADKATQYVCPSCDAPVDVHAGEKKRRHFHHRAGASTCTSESVLHLSAKRLIVQAVDDWLAGTRDAPTFIRTCAHSDCTASTKQALPKKVGAAVVEHRLRTGHVVDVALLARAADLPIGAIEILHTHAVDETKAFELGLPWIEVDAAQACEAGGRVLVPVRDHFLPWLCRDHADTRGDDHAAQRRDRERLAVIARGLDYRIADFPAYRIERVTTCPNGHDAIVFGWDGRSPPDPRPPHLVAFEADLDVTFRRGLGFKKLLPYRRSFASVCPSCGARVDDEE